jgi:ribosomal protein S18 acetylase RimI-like enzyme
VFNDAFARLTRTVLLFEARRRLANCLAQGGVGRAEGSADGALMLALQHRETGSIVAVAELSEQPRDGKVPGDFRLPVAPWGTRPQRVAYVCNLAVLSAWRGRGHGTSLLRSLERIAADWGFGEVYLHAATQQERLLAMYAAQGYEALPSFDQPDWVLALAGREATRYHRKSGI